MPAREQAAAVNQALEEARPARDSTHWTLPEWGHVLHSGLFPLCARINGVFIPIGTSFVVSRLGIVGTAFHNVHEALIHHPNGEALRALRRLPNGLDLNPLGFALLHRHVDRGVPHYMFWPLETVDGAPPTDLAFAFATFQDARPYLAFPLSFVVPRIGSRVRILGYGQMTGEFVDEMAIADGDAAGLLTFGLTPTIDEGRVTQVFTERFAAGFIEGPCFAVDCEMAHGVSGGPVVNEDGFVCGVAAAGASHFFDSPHSLVSIMSPALETAIRFGVEVDGRRREGSRRLSELVASDRVWTDGSEVIVPSEHTPDGWRVGIAIHARDREHAYEQFAALQAGENAQPDRQRRAD